MHGTIALYLLNGTWLWFMARMREEEEWYAIEAYYLRGKGKCCEYCRYAVFRCMARGDRHIRSDSK